MNNLPLSFKLFLLAVFTGNLPGATAQKLPNKQKISLRATVNIKIDGKADDWNNKFQAYNHATDIYYSIANDGENLYLIVQATAFEIINKITGGGITFSIHKSGNKKDKNNISIIYPIAYNTDAPYFKLAGSDNEPDKSKELDRSYNNKMIGQTFKWIKVSGIAGLDEMISVYNTEGIKATGLFDINKHYTYELSVSLHLLGLGGNMDQKFTYHLMVNGRENLISEGTTSRDGGELPPMFRAVQAKAVQRNAPTDFWGEYTLAKN